MTAVIMAFDVIEVNGRRNARRLIKLPHVIKQTWIIDEPPDAALEMNVVDRVKSNERGKETPIRFGNALTAEVSSLRQAFIERVLKSGIGQRPRLHTCLAAPRTRRGKRRD